jgi:hypothetical protein
MSSEEKVVTEKEHETESDLSSTSEIDLYSFHEKWAGRLIMDPVYVLNSPYNLYPNNMHSPE